MNIKHSVLLFCENDKKEIEENIEKYEINDSCLIIGNKKTNLLSFIFNYIYNLNQNTNSQSKVWLLTSKNSNEIQQYIPEYYFFDHKSPSLFNSVEIKYIHSLEELKAFFIACPLLNHSTFHNKYPSCIIIDDFISYFDENTKNVYNISKITAFIQNTLIYINKTIKDQNLYCQLFLSYETLPESFENETYTESKYVIDRNNQPSIPFSYNPIDIINHWIPYRIFIQGNINENYEIHYSLSHSILNPTLNNPPFQNSLSTKTIAYLSSEKKYHFRV